MAWPACPVAAADASPPAAGAVLLVSLPATTRAGHLGRRVMPFLNPQQLARPFRVGFSEEEFRLVLGRGL